MPDDLKHFRVPTFWRLYHDKVWAIVFFVLLILSTIQFEQAKASYEIQLGSGISPIAPRALIAACMNGGAFVWEDPWTGKDKMTTCHTVDSPVRETK